jgi:hypothetical protein
MEHVEDAVTAVRLAREYFILVRMLHRAAMEKTITPDHFPQVIALTKDLVAERQPAFTQEYLCTWTGNVVLSSMAISAQAVDCALDDTFRKRQCGRKTIPDPATRSDLDALRVVMKLVRNAFAHDPFNPTWLPGRQGEKKFTIQNVPGMADGFQLDMRSLKGQPLDFAHLGGDEGYLKLLNLC